MQKEVELEAKEEVKRTKNKVRMGRSRKSKKRMRKLSAYLLHPPR